MVLTWHGIVHGFAALGSGLVLTVAIFVFAARFLAEKRVGWAILSAAVGVVYFGLPWTNADLGSVLLVVASVFGWGWISVIALRLTAQPNAAIETGARLAQPA